MISQQHDPRRPDAVVWERLQAWKTADPVMQRRFLAQLREQTGWSATRCHEAIEEYLRFCLIAAQRGGRVTPSPAVDRVWHLHLTWTRDYWLDFCPNRLGFSLHHAPSLGRPGEAGRLRDDYAATVHAYSARFGDPPITWWPASWAPHGASSRRVASAVAALSLAVLALLLPLPAWAQRPSNPLDWQGPDFLMLYLSLMAATLLGSLVLRAWLQRQLAPTATWIGEPEVWSLAWLAGGPQRVTDAAVAELHRLGKLTWDPQAKRLVPADGAQDSHPVLQTVLANSQRGPLQHWVCDKSAAYLGIRKDLQRRGWWFDADAATRIARNASLPCFALVVFAAAKIAIGLGRDRPVLFLSMLAGLMLLIGLGFLFSRPGATPSGRAALRTFLHKHRLDVRAHRPEQVALAVALVGTTVLAGTALAGYHEMRQPANSDSGGGGDSGSDSGGGGGGGSGCGGCGGGD